MPHNHPKSFGSRTIQEEKVWLNDKTNYHYIQRGIDKTPRGSQVEIIPLNSGIRTKHGVLKNTINYALRHCGHAQLIAYSTDPDDLMLFAIEHEYWIDGEEFINLVESLK